jgi:GDP/UDP-N,N'-diacetylbacillosamine 2-epimerase (hydrolysing)
MKRSICVVTGSRAEYGLLRWVMEGIRAAPDLQLQVVATGAHLSPHFGLTCREIEQDGFVIDRHVEMLLSSDTGVAVAKSMGLGLIGFADALRELHPDLVLVLGDRFEIFSVVAAALMLGIPVAHLHGGEITEGALDDSLRHAITKMSHWHFVAAEEYRRRVIQLGEPPDRVVTVGGLGVDNVKKLRLLDRAALEQSLRFALGAKSLLVTFHPATLSDRPAQQEMGELLAALEPLTDTQLIFTMPNADTQGRALADMVREFVERHPNARAYDSLGYLRYLSCVQHVDGVIGNSSSGLIEAPSLLQGTVNIGDRQRGRLKAASVIDCSADRQSIAAAIRQLYLPAFRAALRTVLNPYGDGGAADKIVQVLQDRATTLGRRKTFHDLPGSGGARP